MWIWTVPMTCAMTSERLERYKLIFEAHAHAAEFRATIIRGLLLVYAALAATFAWFQSQAKPFSFVVPLLAAVATMLFWFADRRHRSALSGSKAVGAAIEEEANIPANQRFFQKMSDSIQDIRHSTLIDRFCLTALILLMVVTGLLICSCGNLRGFCTVPRQSEGGDIPFAQLLRP